MNKVSTHNAPRGLHDVLTWLEQALDETAYGEVGFIATKHGDRIVRIKRIHQTSHQLPPSDHDRHTPSEGAHA